MAAFVGSGNANRILVVAVLVVLLGGVEGVYAATYNDEFGVIMDAAIAADGQLGGTERVKADVLKTALDANDDTTPLVLDLRQRYEYDRGHIPGAINIYYRHLGKTEAINYLNSELAAHNATKKNEIVVYSNTHHIGLMVGDYLNKTQNFPAVSLKNGLADWNASEFIAPSRFKECTSFDGNGKGTSPENCTSNNFTATIANDTDAATLSGENYPTVDCIAGSATSADLAEIARCMYDDRFGDPSKLDFRMDARALYDLLYDGNSSNDPYVLSNRGTDWGAATIGDYYDKGHIPGAIGIDNSDGTNRMELRILNTTDFMPKDKLIVHHCWVGVSQQYGAMWYNLLGYTLVSLDYGMNGWSDSSTVRGNTINPANWYKLDYAVDTGDTGTNNKPYVTLISPTDNADITNNTVTFSVSVWDMEGGNLNVSLWGNWSGWSVKNYTDTTGFISEYNFTVTVPDGIWTWNVRVEDAEGNINWSAANRTINVDTTPPNVTIDSPTNTTYTTSNDIWVNVTAWDNIEGSANTLNVTAELNGTTNNSLTNASGDWNYEWTIPDGFHNITIYANDSVGNMNDTEIVYFTVDAQPPSTSAQQYKLFVPLNTTHHINITWVDDGSSVDSVWLNYTNGTTSTNLSSDYNTSDVYTWIINETYEGTIYVTAYANDSNSHESNISFNYGVTSGTKITLENPENNSWWNTKNVTINGTTTQDANITYSVNGGQNRTAANESMLFLNYTAPADNGTIVQAPAINNITIYAVKKDNVNDSDTVTHNFYVDTIYPNISYNEGTTTPAGNHSQNWIFVNVTVNETNLDTLTLELKGPSSGNYTNWVNDTTNYRLNNTLTGGDYTIRVYVTDRAGNTNVTDERAITLDTTAPVITIDSPANSTITSSSVDLNYSIVESNLNWSGYSQDGEANVTPSGNKTLYNLTNGQHYVTIYANDSAGNENSVTKWFTISSTIESRYENDSVVMPANESVRIDPSYANVTLDIVVNVSLTGAINKTFMTGNPIGTSMTDLSLSKYLQIDASSNIEGNLSYAMVRLYYTDAEVSAAGISEGTMRLYKWNGSAWIRVEDSLPWVNAADVNTTGKYIWANVTTLSLYSAGGSPIPAPAAMRTSRGGGGGPLPAKTVFARAILTTSEDWRYAMMAAGFAAANDYILIVTPTHSIDLLTRNNIKWFDELIIIGDNFVISKEIEDKFKELRRTLVPGFAKLNTTRVKGTSFFGTAVQLAKQWKDPKGIIVVRGDVFADALVAGQLSAATDSPILFTMPREIWPATLNTIKRMKLDVTIIGGEKAVSKEVEDAIKATGVKVKRIGGKDRYATAALVGDKYVKAMEKKGKSIDTITLLSGKKGDWASTLGFRSYMYNSTILYMKEVKGQSAVPTPTKNFIARHPYISSASIVIEDGSKPKGYEDVDAYIKDMQFDVDPVVYNFIMDVDPAKKDYALDTNTKGLSTAVSQKVRDYLTSKGLLYRETSGGGGGGGGC